MNNQLKEAFGEVRAEEELKDRTREFLFQKTNGYMKKRNGSRRQLAVAFSCLFLLLAGGGWLYFTPTVEISVDINPSIELRVNRFNRIVSCESYNEDGKLLLDSLDVRFKEYSEAIDEIAENETIQTLLSEEGVMTITVVEKDNRQARKIYSEIQEDVRETTNTHCYYAQKQDVEEAHEMGLSYGKYRAFQEVQEVNPDITVHDIQGMTMCEIRSLLEESTAGTDADRSGDQETHGGKEKENRHTHQRKHKEK